MVAVGYFVKEKWLNSAAWGPGWAQGGGSLALLLLSQLAYAVQDALAAERHTASRGEVFFRFLQQRRSGMARRHGDGGWSPYLAGALVGVLAIISAYATTAWMEKTHYLGASTTFVRAAGILEKQIDETHVEQNAYFAKTKVRVDWQFMMVVGIFFGALVASRLDGSFRHEWVPPIWRDRFGPSAAKRAVGAFVGGVVAMFGARMASGCPSGHGLSGMMQLSMSAFVALAMFFGVGVVVASLIYRRK
ncbi:MAG TPA: YeeE/YedE family protein [Desulfomicrobiaceae bacterium]|jgi:uncharacterized membrane protein YedE/YeeE|nr:YeeE/YedE family protein [Desulfomicrobiaceae bacterium]